MTHALIDAARTRRWLLGRGVAAAMLPAIASIVAPSPVEAQSPGPALRPTLTAITPSSGDPGSTMDVTLTGTGFGDNGGGERDRTSRPVTSGEISSTSLTSHVYRGHDGHAWSARRDGDDAGRDEQRLDVYGQCAEAGRSDADERLAESRNPRHHGRGHADGHELRRRAPRR